MQESQQDNSIPPITATLWKLPCDMTEEEHHAQQNKLLKSALRRVSTASNKTKRKMVTFAQVASSFGVSVEELRDDSQRWPDTDIKARRIAAVLKSLLHDMVLKTSERRKSAVALLENELKERQLSSSNRVVLEGCGAQVNITMFDGAGNE